MGCSSFGQDILSQSEHRNHAVGQAALIYMFFPRDAAAAAAASTADTAAGAASKAPADDKGNRKTPTQLLNSPNV